MKKNFSIIKSYVVIVAFFLLNIGSIKAQNGPVCDTYKNVGATAATGFPSGRVNGVVASGSTVYVATANGLSISSDGFATFTNKTTANGLGDNWINDIYAYGNTVYAATGSGWSMGGGLSISTDGGATFTNKTTANGLGDNAVNGVYAIGSTVYAATGSMFSGGGLSISTDGGATFTNRTTANGLGNNTVNGVYAIGSTLYAATGSMFSGGGGLSISTDGGATFTNKTTENGLGNNTVNGVYAIGSTVYAATDDGLSISTDGGSSFTNITTENGLGNNTVNGVYAIGSTVYAATTGGLSISTDGGSTFTNYTTANGLGYNSLNGIYASGNSVYAATDDGLSISTNGGTSFTNLSERRPTNNGYATDKTYGVSVSGNTIFASTEKGLSISTNGGTTFSTKTTANGLGTDVLYNAVQVVGSTIYAPTNAGLSISTDGGASFTTKTTANGLGSNYLTSVFVSGNNVYVTSYGGLSISTNGGESFINKTTADGLANNNVRGVHVMGNTLYVATQFGLSISTDGGTTFSNKTTANGLASNYVFAVYATESKLYVACDVGLSISTDGGATFTNKTTANGLGSYGIYNVFVIGSTVYASTGDGLSISTDGGASFTNYNNTNGLGSNAYYGATVYGSVAVSGNTLYVPTYGGLSFCSVCSPPTEGGTIAGTQSLCSPANPAAFTSDALPSGQTGMLEYQWQSSTDNSTFSDIVGASASTYDAPSGLTTTTYYKRLARVDCQSDWSGAVASNVVTVTVITTASPTSAAQTFCGNKTVADLVATGIDLKWYTAATGGTDLATSTAIATGTYYVSQTLNSCEGDRALVSVTVNTTSAPTASAQTFCNSGTLANVAATGSNLKWYTAATGGTDLATSTAIATGTYYVSQTLNSCEGDRTAVAVTVTPQPTAPGKITGATTICKSSTVTYTIDPVANATSYQWTLPAGATGTSTSTSIAVTFSSSYTVGDLCVQAVNGACLSATTCLTITPATAVPATPGVITGPATVLAPSTTKTYTIVPVVNATSYVWTIPANATLVSGQGTTSATFDFGLGYTTGSITVKASNCKGNSATRSLTVKKVGLSVLRATQCGATLVAINTTIYANPIPGATKYRFEVSNNGSVIQTYETTNYYFNLTQLTVKPNYNTAYLIRVTVLFDNVWQDYGSACTVTTPVTPLTKVKATQCGQTLAFINSTLSADVVVNANKYQFEIRKNDIVVQELTSDLYYTRLTNLAVGAEYGTTYSIRVRYSFDTGTTWSDYGTYCSVTTPVAPLTKLRTTQCGQTLALINSTLSADVVVYANKYQFEISKNNTVVQELFSNTYYTSLSTSTTKVQYGTSYTIRVKYSLDNGVTWSEYGTSCSLTTPTLPLTTKVKATQCGSTLASLNSPISADIVINANNYQFEISKDNAVIQELTSSLYYTRLTNLTAGAQNGTTYSIRVRYSFDNGATWSAYGIPCNVTSPSAQGLVIAARNSPEATIAVYPNPYTSTFKLATSFEGEVNVKVIDNIGKLIEQFDIDAGELVTKELGQEYVPGMYHVTVTQEMNSKNFKVVKSN